MIKGKYGKACAAVRAVLSPYLTSSQVNSVCRFIGGLDDADGHSKVALAQPPIEPVMSMADAMKLTGLSKCGLYYHAKKGRIRTAHIKGSSRSLGFVASDIADIVQGRA